VDLGTVIRRRKESFLEPDDAVMHLEYNQTSSKREKYGVTLKIVQNYLLSCRSLVVAV